MKCSIAILRKSLSRVFVASQHSTKSCLQIFIARFLANPRPLFFLILQIVMGRFFNLSLLLSVEPSSITIISSTGWDCCRIDFTVRRTDSELLKQII